jgi:hypothetical protein
MPLVFSRERLVLRVDGDVLEIFLKGRFSERVLLAWLAVQVRPLGKGRLGLRIASAQDDGPLYEVFQKARVSPGSSVDLDIGAEEEPLYREFFTQVAQLCGRPVVP